MNRHLLTISEAFLQDLIFLVRIVKYWEQRTPQNKLRAVLDLLSINDKSGIEGKNKRRHELCHEPRTPRTGQLPLPDGCTELTQGGSLRCKDHFSSTKLPWLGE